MKAKIFGRLKQEYSPLGLGDDVMMSLAESIAAVGLVTDDNIDAVVASYRPYLESLQKHNDKRVADALKKREEEARKKEEEARKKAEEETRAEVVVNAAEETGKEGADPAIEALRKQMAELRASNEKARKEYESRLKVITDANSSLEVLVKTLSEENNQAKAERAKAAFDAKINAKAKELGVPEWRIAEGFTIAEDADDETIGRTLATVANNIKTNLLPGNKGVPFGKDEPSAEQINEMAASLVK